MSRDEYYLALRYIAGLLNMVEKGDINDAYQPFVKAASEFHKEQYEKIRLLSPEEEDDTTTLSP